MASKAKQPHIILKVCPFSPGKYLWSCSPQQGRWVLEETQNVFQPDDPTDPEPSLQASPKLGNVGHVTAAYVAQYYLDGKGKGFLNQHLPRIESVSLYNAARWADKIKEEHPETRP